MIEDKTRQYRDPRGNVWFWTGHTWETNNTATPDVLRKELPAQYGPFKVVE